MRRTTSLVILSSPTNPEEPPLLFGPADGAGGSSDLEPATSGDISLKSARSDSAISDAVRLTGEIPRIPEGWTSTNPLVTFSGSWDPDARGRRFGATHALWRFCTMYSPFAVTREAWTSRSTNRNFTVRSFRGALVCCFSTLLIDPLGSGSSLDELLAEGLQPDPTGAAVSALAAWLDF